MKTIVKTFNIEKSFPLKSGDIKNFFEKVINMFLAQKDNRIDEYLDKNPDMETIFNKLNEWNNRGK